MMNLITCTCTLSYRQKKLSSGFLRLLQSMNYDYRLNPISDFLILYQSCRPLNRKPTLDFLCNAINIFQKHALVETIRFC